MATYDPKWPERLWNAGYTIRGGFPEKSIDNRDIGKLQGPCGCHGCAGPDDAIPDGFKYKQLITLFIEPRVSNPKQNWNDVKTLVEKAIETGRQQKYDYSKYRESEEGQHVICVENGSKAMMDLLRTGAVCKEYVGYTGSVKNEERLDWTQTQQTFNQLSSQTPLYRDVMSNVRSFVGA